MLFRSKKEKKHQEKLEYENKSNGEVWKASGLLISYKTDLRNCLEDIYDICKKELKDPGFRKIAFELWLTEEYVHYAAFYALVNDLYWFASSKMETAEKAAVLMDYVDANYEVCASWFQSIDDDLSPAERIATVFLLFYKLKVDRQKIAALVGKCEDLYTYILEIRRYFIGIL